MAARCIQTVRAKARTLVNFAWRFRYRRHVLGFASQCLAAWLINRFHVHSALGCTPFQSLLGKPCKGRVAKFGHDMSCMALHNWINMVATPGELLKTATPTKGKYPHVPLGFLHDRRR